MKTDVVAVSRHVVALGALLGLAAGLDAAARPHRQVDDSRQGDRVHRQRQSRSQPAPEAPPGAPSDIMPGVLDWLAGAQGPSGSWGSTFEFADTAMCVDALGEAQPAGLAFQDGAGWLTSHPALDHDELSRKILALVHLVGLDLEDEVDTLLAGRNAAESNPAAPNYPEGGWGLEPGFETDSLTTALALLALDATGREAGISEVNQPLAPATTNIHTWQIAAGATKARIVISVAGSTVRLRMAQGAPPSSGAPFFSLAPGAPYNIVFPDSGLPFTSGTNYISVESPNPPGAAATYTFTASYETPSFDTRSFAEALAYLREAQNGDGGFGLQAGDTTSFYTTLHVMLALESWEGYDFDAEIALGVNHVLSRQLPDGSFGTGGTPIPYLTALATLVLLRADPCPLGPDTLDAVDAVRALKDPNDSWDDEPYDTALSLLALFQHDNDGDEIFRDGNCSGTEGDSVCAPGVTTSCDDNCRAYYNPTQNPVVFGQTIRAPNKVSFTWPDPVDIVFVRGPLADVDTYGVTAAGTAAGATSLGTSGDVPAPGTGFYYLLRLGGDCTVASWQTSLGAEPGRDQAPLGEVGVQITSPVDGAVLTSSPTTVSGTVDGVDPVSVTVNGVSAGVTGANFNASVPLARGLNTVTALATDAAGFTGSDQITVRLVDHSIPRGSFATGFRVFTGSSSTLDQTAFFTEQQSGVPPGVTYTTTSVTRISATEMRVGYRIDVAPGAAIGIYDFQVMYGLLDANQQPLGPLSGNVFQFEIRVTP